MALAGELRAALAVALGAFLPLRRSHLLRYFCNERSIRAQLLLVVALMNVIARLIGGTVAILRVRAQTGIEMAALLAAAQ